MQRDHLWPYVKQELARKPARELSLEELQAAIKTTRGHRANTKALSRLLKQKCNGREALCHSVTQIRPDGTRRRFLVYYIAPSKQLSAVNWDKAIGIARAALKRAKQERLQIVNDQRYMDHDEMWSSESERGGIPEDHLLWKDVADIALAELRATFGFSRKARANEVLAHIRRTLARSFEIEVYFLKDPGSRQVSQTGSYSVRVLTPAQSRLLRKANKDIDWQDAEKHVKAVQERHLSRK